MFIEILKYKLYEQEEIYTLLKDGDGSKVCYKPYQNKEYGCQDENYTARMRLAYYILYADIDDEKIIYYLFNEELKDRKNNSFQGIGNCLNVLTCLINRYNFDGEYNNLLDEAKSANFDCQCGYEKNFYIDGDISKLDLLDCIWLVRDLNYKDTMAAIVDIWKESITQWDDSSRNILLGFNSFLGRETENEAIHRKLLESTLKTGKISETVMQYNKIINYYIAEKQYETAYRWLKQMTDTTNFESIIRIRLFSSVLEECCDIACSYPEKSEELWQWTKPYILTRTNMYGNLYTKAIAAAKAAKDSYADILAKEYDKWKKEMKIVK